MEYSNTEKRLKKESLNVNKETLKKSVRDTRYESVESGTPGGTPYHGLYREAPPESGTFLGLRYMNGYSDFPS